MFIKKIIIGIFLLSFLNSCAQNVALIGPVYTLASTGNVYQAGLSYGSEHAISKLTGKSTGENIKQILLKPQKKDTEFQRLVKRRVKETRKKLNLTD
jgi:hypothetical protein